MLRLLAGLALLAQPASAGTIQVEEGGSVPTLAAALVLAVDGDTIRLGPGSYFECAIIRQRNLVLEGSGEASVITDRLCEGKALLVVRGDGLTVRNLVLARARSPERNGAGIRLEGQNLVLERVRFENDEVGLLAGQGGMGSIRVDHCIFSRGGVAGDRPTAALLVDAVASLRVENSVFEGVKGRQISSGAVRTELVGNRIGTGVEPGDATAVLAGGRLRMEDNTLVVGPHPPGRDAAVVATGDRAELQHNRMENTTGRRLTLLLDWTHSRPVVDGNVVAAGDAEVSSSGVWRHRVGGAAREAYGDARQAAGSVKRAVGGLFGR